MKLVPIENKSSLIEVMSWHQKRQQALIWTKIDQFQWCIYLAFMGLNHYSDDIWPSKRPKSPVIHCLFDSVCSTMFVEAYIREKRDCETFVFLPDRDVFVWFCWYYTWLYTGVLLVLLIFYQSRDQLVSRYIENIKVPLLAVCEGKPLVTSGSPHKGPVMRRAFPFDNVIMWTEKGPSIKQTIFIPVVTWDSK